MFSYPEKDPLDVDLKNPEQVKMVLDDIIPNVDVLMESFRPGVMERLGLGPEQVHKVNPSLVYVRLTGFGQMPSEYRDTASHDSNYLAIAGLLSKFRQKDQPGQEKGIPNVPGNIVADYSSGSLGSFALTLQALCMQKMSKEPLR